MGPTEVAIEDLRSVGLPKNVNRSSNGHHVAWSWVLTPGVGLQRSRSEKPLFIDF